MRLTEGDLRRIVNKSVRRALNEVTWGQPQQQQQQGGWGQQQPQVGGWGQPQQQPQVGGWGQEQQKKAEYLKQSLGPKTQQLIDALQKFMQTGEPGWLSAQLDRYKADLNGAQGWANGPQQKPGDLTSWGPQ